jgi:hypothetical protein
MSMSSLVELLSRVHSQLPLADALGPAMVLCQQQ